MFITSTAQRSHLPQHWIDIRPLADQSRCGDFADCFPLGRNRFAIVIGDIAGRGLATGKAARGVHAYARHGLASGTPLSTIVAEIDYYFTRVFLCEGVPVASIFIGVAETEDGVFDYASAGHEPALHFVTRTRHDHLDPTGPLLGLKGLLRNSFGLRRVHTSADSVLVLVTDGITEARRDDASAPTFFGSGGVARALSDARKTGDDPACAIADAATRHARGSMPDDTAVVVAGLGRSSVVDEKLAAAGLAECVSCRF